MKTCRHFLTLALLAGSFVLNSSSTAASLKIGDPAPPLKVSKWIQGDPVQSFDSNHVYIVEFWTSGSGICRASIPRLNEISKKYQDQNVIVIGEDCWEQNENEAGDLIKKLDEKPAYRLALDDKSSEPYGATAVSWMRAAGQNTIPVIFIVNRAGQIAWIGAPLTLPDSVLDQILAGKFDEDAYAREFEKRQTVREQLQTLNTKLRVAMQDGNWDSADATLTQIENILPENARFEAYPARVQILVGRKDLAGATKMAGMLSDQYPTNAILQNEMAWALTTAKGMDEQGLALAEKIAGRANQAAGGKISGILDTLARTQFMTGETNEAVATEQKAVDIAPEESKPYLQKFLDSYKQGQLPELQQ